MKLTVSPSGARSSAHWLSATAAQDDPEPDSVTYVPADAGDETASRASVAIAIAMPARTGPLRRAGNLIMSSSASFSVGFRLA